MEWSEGRKGKERGDAVKGRGNPFKNHSESFKNTLSTSLTL